MGLVSIFVSNVYVSRTRVLFAGRDQIQANLKTGYNFFQDNGLFFIFVGLCMKEVPLPLNTVVVNLCLC